MSVVRKRRRLETVEIAQVERTAAIAQSCNAIVHSLLCVQCAARARKHARERSSSTEHAVPRCIAFSFRSLDPKKASAWRAHDGHFLKCACPIEPVTAFADRVSFRRGRVSRTVELLACACAARSETRDADRSHALTAASSCRVCYVLLLPMSEPEEVH